MGENLYSAKIQVFVQFFGQKTWAKNCTTVFRFENKRLSGANRNLNSHLMVLINIRLKIEVRGDVALVGDVEFGEDEPELLAVHYA